MPHATLLQEPACCTCRSLLQAGRVRDTPPISLSLSLSLSLLILLLGWHPTVSTLSLMFYYSMQDSASASGSSGTTAASWSLARGTRKTDAKRLHLFERYLKLLRGDFAVRSYWN